MICFPLDNTPYEAKEMGAYLCTRTRGVFSADDNLAVSPGTEGLSVIVSPGIAWFKWSEYWGTAAVQEKSLTLKLDAADGALERLDVVVGRLDKVGNLADISIRKGAFSSAPAITDPVRDESADEIYLSSVRVRAGAVSITAEDITDMRLNEEYCGLMRDGVTGIPTAQLQEQAQELIDHLNEEIKGIEQGSEVMLKTVYDPRGVAKDVFAQIPNPNELTNSGFMKAQRVNQRGASGTISSTGYFIDRWKLVSGTVQLTDDGLVLNGTIAQVLERAIGTPFSASVSAGTASYDDASKTFSITGTGVTVAWAKLEKGDVATPWQPKGYGAELAECIRFFRQIRVDWQTYSGAGYNARVPVALVPPMRTAPTASDASRYVFNCTLSGLEFSTAQGGAIALNVTGAGATAYSSLLKLSADL